MSRDRGFVLINALVVIAAISALSVGVIRDASAGLDRLAALRDADRLDLALDAGAVAAMQLLVEDARTSDIDHLGEAWALDGQSQMLEDQSVTMTIEDLQGRFNLNALLQDDAVGPEAAFRALALDHGTEDAVVDGMLDHFAALREKPGRRPTDDPAAFAAREVVLPGELVGVTGEALDALMSELSLLPDDAALNLNTGRKAAVMALLGVHDDTAWDTFDGERRAGPFESVDDALAAVTRNFGEAAASGLTDAQATVASKWFEVRVTVRQAGASRAAVFLVHRPEGEATVNVVMRVPDDV